MEGYEFMKIVIPILGLQRLRETVDNTIISKTSILSGYLKIYFSICVGLGSIFGGFLSSKKCNFKGMLSGLLSSLPNSIIITIIMIVFSGGQLKESTIIIFLLIVICSILGGIIGANTKRRK